MNNSFFSSITDEKYLNLRLKELDHSKVGFYSVGLYPVSLAYNCALHTELTNLLLAPRPGRELFGAFSKSSLNKMEEKYLSKIKAISFHYENGEEHVNSLEYLISNCDIVILSSNSNHIENDLNETIALRTKLNREQVLIACLVGSFCHDPITDSSYVLCEKESNLAFFSGFHRHGALLNPTDSFTANFCHPDSLISMIGAKILNSLSPNIQVSSGIHNLEGQYIKAAKNISSIFAGFAHTYHIENPGLLPSILTLLLDQCLSQAAKVSISRKEKIESLSTQSLSLTELGYGVEKIEASVKINDEKTILRDHTFSQLTAMVADVRGSMMAPISGKPTRNFQAGQVLAENMKKYSRCPYNIDEFIDWCELFGLRKGDLEGLKSLSFWPEIKNNYSIEFHESSMINLLYFSVFGEETIKSIVFNVLTDSRELSCFCQESPRPTTSRNYFNAINNLSDDEAISFIVRTITNNISDAKKEIYTNFNNNLNNSKYKQAISIIESLL